MSDGEALLRACLESLGDTAPRLILADYLDERGVSDAANLRLPGYWWAIEDKTRLQVASIIYWRAPTADRVLFRVGVVGDYRAACKETSNHSDPRSWMGVKEGWVCTFHIRYLWKEGNAVLAAEQAHLDKRIPRKRRKWPHTLDATDPKRPTPAQAFAELARIAEPTRD